jgi:hypothetical protein
MQFSEAVKSGIEIVKLNRAIYRKVAETPEAFSQALIIAALVGIASWLSPPSFAIHGIILGPLWALIGLFVGSAILHFVATLFGGKGQYMPLLRVLGIGRVLGWVRLIPVIGAIVDLWSLVIAVVALEELYGLDRTKAILTVIIPAAVLLVLGLIALALLTHANAEASNYPFCTIEKNVGVVAIDDPNLKALAEALEPAEVTPAAIEFVDIAGLVRGASKGEGLGNKFLGHIRDVDAVVHVVRCFSDENVAHVDGRVDAIADLEIVDTELLLADLESLERIRERAQKNAKADPKAAQTDLQRVDALLVAVKQGVPLRKLPLGESEKEWAREFRLLSIKPQMVVANVGEDDLSGGGTVEGIRKQVGSEVPVLAMPVKIEEEISQLAPEEQDDPFRDAGAASRRAHSHGHGARLHPDGGHVGCRCPGTSQSRGAPEARPHPHRGPQLHRPGRRCLPDPVQRVVHDGRRPGTVSGAGSGESGSLAIFIPPSCLGSRDSRLRGVAGQLQCRAMGGVVGVWQECRSAIHWPGVARYLSIWNWRPSVVQIVVRVQAMIGLPQEVCYAPMAC